MPKFWASKYKNSVGANAYNEWWVNNKKSGWAIIRLSCQPWIKEEKVLLKLVFKIIRPKIKKKTTRLIRLKELQA